MWDSGGGTVNHRAVRHLVGAEPNCGSAAMDSHGLARDQPQIEHTRTVTLYGKLFKSM